MNNKLIKTDVDRSTPESVSKIIIGNKIDLKSERKVKDEDVFEFCESLQIPYIETSSKENINIEESFLLLIYQILSSMSKYSIPYLHSISFNGEWKEEIHFKLPKPFKDSIFTFIICLNLVGFNKKKNKKIPKFVLFEIIKKSSNFSLSKFVKEYSKNEKLILSPSYNLPPVILDTKTNKKKDCQIF